MKEISTLQEKTEEATKWMLVTIVFFLILSLVIARSISSKISGSLSRLVNTSKKISNLNFDHEVHLEGPLEIHQLAIAFEKTRKELQKAFDEKEQLISELTENSLKLKSSNEYLEQFAFAASHDLQAPIRHIEAYVNILMDELQKK